VKRLLLNCDQVFEVLTRGPFPSGNPQDEAVERHLRACHECRQLAEALRPAVALMHEAVSSDEADRLPEYQGSLPWQRRSTPQKPPKARLAGSSRSQRRPANRAPTMLRGEPRPAQMLSGIRMIAASLILAALGLVFGSNILVPAAGEPGKRPLLQAAHLVTSPLPDVTPGPSNRLPTAQGLLTLASLKLPNNCLPYSHRPISSEEAVEIADAISTAALGSLRCCTDCHRSGSNQSSGPRLVASLQQSCQACHRG